MTDIKQDAMDTRPGKRTRNTKTSHDDTARVLLVRLKVPNAEKISPRVNKATSLKMRRALIAILAIEEVTQ